LSKKAPIFPKKAQKMTKNARFLQKNHKKYQFFTIFPEFTQSFSKGISAPNLSFRTKNPHSRMKIFPFLRILPILTKVFSSTPPKYKLPILTCRPNQYGRRDNLGKLKRIGIP
jgi:hypothetical protein